MRQPEMIRAYRSWFGRWLERRIPAAPRVVLDRHRIFIFPSRVGFFFFCALLVMLVAAINYENNMAYALTFLLTTLFLIAILHTYANLSGLTLQAGESPSGFPGDLLPFSLRLSGAGQNRFALVCRWRNRTLAVGLAQVDVPRGSSADLLLYARADRRGRFRPGRVLVESTYPLGLLRCWTWVDLDMAAVVYPAPLPYPEAQGRDNHGAQNQRPTLGSDDELSGLREYRRGDRMRQVYWKGLARGQPLQSKHYASTAGPDDRLDWDAYPGVPTEQRLSYLCRQCLDLHAAGRRYALRLPALDLPPGSGSTHRDRVLTALALRAGSPG